MKQSKPRKSRKMLVKDLDRVFSIYIRLRDCLYTMRREDIGKCVTCGNIVTFSNCDAGHFRGRQHMATRWNEQNVNLQCKLACNKYGQGKAYEYGIALKKKYGENVPDMLTAESKKTRKYYDYELEALIELYAKKIEDLHAPVAQRVME